MKISKKDALMWFEFFAALPEEEELMPHQQEIALAALAQIETAVNKRREAMASRIDGLQSLSGRTYFVGDRAKFPRGCCSCLLGTGLSAVRKTNRCNVQCKFCYNYGELDVQPPIGEGMWEIGGTKFYEDDIDLLLSIQKKPTGVAYVYLEPFMEIEKYYGIIRKFHEAGVHQHMYTNGTLATEENLRALGEAGLDELRAAHESLEKELELIRITDPVREFVAQTGVKNGVVYVITEHTTTGIMVNESLPCVEKDIMETLNRIAPEDYPYHHNHYLPTYGTIGGNAPGHLKSLLTGNHCVFPIAEGKIKLGSAADIYFCEYDGIKNRKYMIYVMGE